MEERKSLKELLNNLKEGWEKKNFYYPFFAAVICGLLTHMFCFVNKLPNADAMTNFYFDQNMVTSGRWFLGIACGISSYFDLNWVIGVLVIFYLGIASVVLCDIFKVKSKTAAVIVACLVVTFPAVTATNAYLYTADGYMIGLILAFLAVWFASKYKCGFIPGGICLAFSMGIYQAYLASTILICIFLILRMLNENNKLKDILKRGLEFVAMGAIGGIVYYVVLKLCLALQHKELDTYQGINQMGKLSISDIPGRIIKAYYDFAAFALKGRIFFRDGFSFGIMVLLGVVLLTAVAYTAVKSGAFKKWYFYCFAFVMVVFIPLGCNVILLISSDSYYHLLMRMQWGLFTIIPICAADRVLHSPDFKESGKKVLKVILWIAPLASAILVYFFAVTDNIAYFNMNERYEKTYAYCLRLADRIEQTPGYYTGMPIAMIGVVNEENYPDTDITFDVTGRISGSDGSILTYKAEQYAAFMKHYLNVTIEYIEGDQIVEIYNSPEYQALDSFPAENSITIVDGVMYIKTE